MSWWRSTGLQLLLLGGLAGCARFESKPISPAQTAADFESRSLNDPGLKQFLEKNLQRELTPWPLAKWDFPTLTLAALYYHPSMDVARAQWGLAQASIRTAHGRPNPSLSVIPEYSVNPDKGVSPWLATVNFDIPIETAGKRGYRIARAQHLSEAARLNLAVQAWQVRSRLRMALLEHATAQRRATLLQAQFDAQQQLLNLLEQRLAAGAAAAPEITPARVALLTVQTDLADAKRLVRESRVRIAEAIGLPLTAIDGIEIDWPLAFQAGGELASTELRRQALQARADIRAALAEYAASQSALQIEIAKQYPDVHIGPGYQYDQGQNKWALGVTAELPLLNQNQGPIAESEAKRAEAAARFVELQAKVIAEIERALQSRVASEDQLKTSESLLQTQRKQADALQAAFQAGAADRYEASAAQLQAAIAELALLNARSKVQQALGQLEEALQVPFEALNSVEQGRPTQAMKEKP
jgi:outer membrane protein TolC